jgi:broad specificity phosphatase PhoE
MRRLARSSALLLALLLPAAALAGQPDQTSRAGAAGATTVVIVRHAEKATDDPRDPALSPSGQARAEALAAALEGAEVAAVYATPFKRTRATAAPTAARARLTVEERTPGADSAADAVALAREVIAHHAGQTVLVVGHSNTVPELVRAFSGRTVEPLTDNDYDHLYIVVVPPAGAGPARLFQTRYGAPSPG